MLEASMTPATMAESAVRGPLPGKGVQPARTRVPSFARAAEAAEKVRDATIACRTQAGQSGSAQSGRTASMGELGPRAPKNRPDTTNIRIVVGPLPGLAVLQWARE